MPEFPKELRYIWRIYCRLRARTSGGFSGPNPIGWQDIDAFVRRTGHRLAPWEIEILEAVDNAFVTPIARPQSPIDNNMVELADVNDPRAVKALLLRFQAAKNKREE